MNSRATIAGAILVAGGLMTATAHANDAVFGALLGAGAGAVIGAAVAGHDGAIVGGAIGAVSGAVAARSNTVVGIHGVGHPHAGTYAGGAPVRGYVPVHGAHYGHPSGHFHGQPYGYGYRGHDPYYRPPVVVMPARGHRPYGHPRVIVAPPVVVAPPPQVIYVKPRGYHHRHPYDWHGPRY